MDLTAMTKALFTVTPWRDSAELLKLRQDLYSGGYAPDGERRERAINKILAWRARKHEMPLALDSTVDLVDAMVQEEKGSLPHNSLRLLYAAAISRFVTGFADSQAGLARNRAQPMEETAPPFDFPASLLETRHCIVHRHLPSLPHLKHAADESLHWLWSWFWAHLDLLESKESASPPSNSLDSRDVAQNLQTILKTYVRYRKAELKSQLQLKSTKTDRRESSGAAKTAVKACVDDSQFSSKTLKLLIVQLVDQMYIIPSDKKLGSIMEGAYLIWTPLFLVLVNHQPSLFRGLITHIQATLDTPSSPLLPVSLDPKREAMCQWLLHILTSDAWSIPRSRYPDQKLLGEVMSECLTSASFWNLKLAEWVLNDKAVRKSYGQDFCQAWSDVLKAAREETDVERKMDDVVENTQSQDTTPDETPTEMTVTIATKGKGIQKGLGMWRRQPIGALPIVWGDDE
ncbi:Las1-domain-containing protein [Lindgomyces ingoldianus]|uniref:Las1-domain-containing protein n=1 Tax=Lindgomyces ingoldianus TaxID=673940 RepID=A0ACB6QRQ1_9PLEO|nr:Las1-domain-containing protein [Lindgomyces ingoldianus]KAF2468846.1 Las1-domain-containing protein [Lindgomyces ingoldianus]